ncbi:host attachment protein [Muricoccus vinaceus]|uniref:Host attachment protein n=1 Tax=Muricoccus vinaceus TaxID=424704 RepID=A0ABV6J1A7_9PROT
MSKQGATWYVVADGQKARVLVGGEGGMRTQHSFDASGRGNVVEDADSGVSQLKAPRANPKDQAEGRFGRAVADYLNEGVRLGQTASLVIAASPSILHEIREGLNKQASAVVEKTMSKDLTNIADAEMASHFA